MADGNAASKPSSSARFCGPTAASTRRAASASSTCVTFTSRARAVPSRSVRCQLFSRRRRSRRSSAKRAEDRAPALLHRVARDLGYGRGHPLAQVCAALSAAVEYVDFVASRRALRHEVGSDPRRVSYCIGKRSPTWHVMHFHVVGGILWI